MKKTKMAETIVMYPAPGIGHLIAMVELGKLLLSHSLSLSSSITILVPSFPIKFSGNDSISPYISSVSSAFPSISFHSLPFVPLSRGNDVSNYPNMESVTFESLRNNNPNIKDFLVSLSSSSSSAISAFVVDFFCYSALDVSRDLKIPTYFFFTSGANALALFLNFPVFDRMIPNDSFRNLKTSSFAIPGLFAVGSSQMLDPMLDRGDNYDEFVNMGVYLGKADGIIVNTFEALEFRAVSSLKRGTCLPGFRVPPIYSIGPLIADRGEKQGQRHECLRWLDSKPTRSVVYLSFGSMGRLSLDQTREIAVGLEKSEVRFLWVVRPPPSEDRGTKFEPPSEPDLDTILPEGFLDRTKDRGFVVKSWAPQIDVLAHDSTSGFVSHCGWNSTLEAVCAGVPMVAWPLYAEQRFNKIALVQELGIALPMNESEDRFVCSDEVEKRVKQIVNSNEGDVVRKRMLELRSEAKLALKEEGSSKIALASLVESLKRDSSNANARSLGVNSYFTAKL